MRRTLGTAVFSGMLGVTLFGIFLTPVFFIVIDWLGDTRLFASRLDAHGSRLHRRLAVVRAGLPAGRRSRLLERLRRRDARLRRVTNVRSARTTPTHDRH